MSNDLSSGRVPFAPVYDVWVAMQRLLGVAECLAYLTSPRHLKEDDELEIFHEPLMDMAERLSDACEQIELAVKGVVFQDEVVP